MNNSTKVLLIDNYDSFTYNLAQYLWELGYETLVERNDKINISQIESLNPSHIIISPGPSTPNEAGISLDILKNFYDKKPILGVCLGHQCIGQFFGGQIIKAPLPKHGKVSIIEHQNSILFNEIPASFKATRYHSLIINEITFPKDELNIIAHSQDDNLIMAIEHIKYPIYGVQFHPESIMSEFGHQLLKNFIQNK